jgi:phage shock protein A
MSRTSKRRSSHEDLRVSLDYFYQTQLEELTQMRVMVRDVAMNRKRLELQVNSLRQAENRLKGLLDKAVADGQEGEAGEAKTRLASVERRLQSLQWQYDKSVEHEREVVHKSQAMQQLVESFRTNKEAVKAEYSIAIAATPGSRKFGDGGNSTTDEINDHRAVKLGAVTDLLSPDLMGASELRD